MIAPNDQPRISGQKFVPPFLLAISLALLATAWLLFKTKNARETAYDKTFPLQATLNASCREPGSAPYDLRQLAHCPADAQLEFAAVNIGSSVKGVAWAIVGGGKNDIVIGQFAPGQPSAASLAALPPDTYVLTFIVQDRLADLVELRRAIVSEAGGPSIFERLEAIAEFTTFERHNGADVRTDRIEFKVEAAAK